MDSIQTFNCASCKAVNNQGDAECSSCKESLTIATLKCLGTGNVPEGYVWPVFPYDMSIGSSTSNDIVIPSSRVAKKHCRLVHQNGSVFIDRSDKANTVLVNRNNIQVGIIQKLNEGAVLKIGLDEFTISYHNIAHTDMNLKTEAEKVQRKLDMRHANNPVASRLMLILGYLQELHASMDVKDLLSNSVDAVLKLTGLDRGYAFIVEYVDDQMSLKEVISRKIGGLDFFEKDYTISRSMLTKVMQSNGTVIIEDADSDSLSTNSMRDFKIKSIACLPLVRKDPQTKESVLLGVIYADKMMSTTKLPKHIQSNLQTLSQLIVANLDRCQKFKDARDMCEQYDEYLKNLASEINTVGENLNVIAENMEQVTNVDNFQALHQYISGEHLKMTSIIRSVLAASE
ncbi:MAG: FHA domain-containing protein [Lentisphaeraceae bacterium]|nr:FHA domain-containing protein [Lentisphaeraceae bacterium]